MEQLVKDAVAVLVRDKAPEFVQFLLAWLGVWPKHRREAFAKAFAAEQPADDKSQG